MRRLFIIISILIVSVANGQQEPQYSNYQMNNFMLNPAVAGSYTYMNAKIGYRGQWVTMPGSPRTFFATYQGSIHHPDASARSRRHWPHHGVGAYVFSDKAGAYSYSGLSGTYAYHIHFNKTYALSLGGSVGLKQLRIDGTDFQFVDQIIDPGLGRGVYNKLLPDANLGFWLYSKDLFFGAAARQILRSNLDITSADAGGELARQHSHYFATGGYKFGISNDWSFIPSLMLQYVAPAPAQIDINGTFWFQEKLALGFSYRNRDALYFILDLVVKDKLEFGYAFDFTISELSNYNAGSHEVILGIKWGAVDSKIKCPGQFW